MDVSRAFCAPFPSSTFPNGQKLRGEPVMSSISAKFSTFPGFPSINPGFGSFSQSEDDTGEITKIPREI